MIGLRGRRRYDHEVGIDEAAPLVPRTATKLKKVRAREVNSRFLRMAVSSTLALGAGFMVAACVPYSESDFAGNEPPELEVYEPEEDPNYAPDPDYYGSDFGPMPERWSCIYSPSYDNDWHNDVVCSNGIESHRPYLREWDSFVTEDEIMSSAAEYENDLNAGF